MGCGVCPATRKAVGCRVGFNVQAAVGDAAYMKRDAAMVLANQQVASDPWYFWPGFVELGS